MKTLNIGILGLGFIGQNHAKILLENKVKNARLHSVFVRRKESLEKCEIKLPTDVLVFTDLNAFYGQEDLDGVIICTPHYSHPDLGQKAFEAGLHVLLEKPTGVYTKNVRTLNASARASQKKFATMFNMRFKPIHVKMKELLTQGALGKLKRVHWTATACYRSQAYYDSNHWRATWAGEGGGVLVNQASHHLDLFQWFFGMPERLQAFCHFGKYHQIEVEDSVTSYMEFASGLTATFITSTGESPGRNQLEVVGEKGSLLYDGKQIRLDLHPELEPDWNAKNKDVWANPPVETNEFVFEVDENSHAKLIQNWVDAIGEDCLLLAPGEDGLNSLMLSNAMLLSTWQNCMVDLPLNDDVFYEKLSEVIANSDTQGFA